MMAKVNYLNDRFLPQCLRQIASRTYDQPLALINEDGAAAAAHSWIGHCKLNRQIPLLHSRTHVTAV